MEEYIAFMNRKHAKLEAKLLLASAATVALFCTVAYLNTRYNGFADVKPSAHYVSLVRGIWEYLSEVVNHSPVRFINIF